MLTLLTYPRNGDVFSLSPFCVKAALLLAYSKKAWQREDLNDPRKMPHRKLPVLKTPAGLVADSVEIRKYLEKLGTDFDHGLSVREKAQSQFLIRFAEDNLYFHVVQDRWLNDAVWPTIRDTYFKEIPALIRRPVTNSIRRSVRNGLAFQGTGRFSDGERLARLDQDLQAVTSLLKDRGFLFGSQITSADFSVASMLQALQTTMVETDIVRRVSGDPKLSGYINRVFQEAVPLP
ncbi:glutathione S-transferase family protein [Parasedimentitalea maritima]|uniref:Glutathione S-transferase family protein n=1 Tax=Parasedimentitalea maritima TaxID=2578117 RepID=A0ABY2UZ34_9RHOB|nr:glutathione S-transferase family protein [Zongyanglinia marina]TLP68734.1 glutathione S-transferase family protein [Zongyanglinia marina]